MRLKEMEKKPTKSKLQLQRGELNIGPSSHEVAYHTKKTPIHKKYFPTDRQ